MLGSNVISFQLLKRNLTSSFFKPRQKKFNSSISLSFGGKPLKQSNTTKFLSILTIISPVNTISAMQVNIELNQKEIYRLRSRFFLSSKTKLTLNYTLIYPYIVYCNPAWSSTNVPNLNRIYFFAKASSNQLRLSRTPFSFILKTRNVRCFPSQYV